MKTITKTITKTLELAGRPITFRIGEVAQQATSAVITQYGETTILTTVVIGRENTELDYFPLNIEYAEKLYAGGKIKGSRWVKREGKPTDDAILTARLIDRSVRPLFNPVFRRDVQVINTMLTVDGVNSPEITAALSTSCALSLCSIPWNGPIATLQIGHLSGEKGEGHFVINPTLEEELLSNLDLTVSVAQDKVVMIECRAEEASNKQIIEGILLAKKEGQRITKFFSDIKKEWGVKAYVHPPVDKDYEKIAKDIIHKYEQQCFDRLRDMADKESVSNGTDDFAALLVEEFELEEKELGKVLEMIYKKLVKKLAFEKNERIDGRAFDEVRPLSAQVGFLPRVHGSALFSRGATQVLSIATLGPLSLSQLIENPEGEFAKRYIHHYHMPPYTVGETGRIGFPSRREIGHGALAEKGVEPMLPTEEKFPYTIRVVSEVLSSNGSTSMASTCGSSLALMDAGVPVKEQVGGIAIGIVRESDEKYKLLTDIIGLEDFFGEMDFKVSGTKNGATAIQLDVKNNGLTDAMIHEAVEQATKAREKILEVMDNAINKPRVELSRYAPRIVTLRPPQEKIGEIIGPGGKNIKKLIADTGCEIDIDDNGVVSISGTDPDGIERAAKHISAMSKVYKVGEKYKGIVAKVLPFGAVVEIGPGKDGLLHVSQMGMGFVKDAGEIFKVGQEVEVEIAEMDERGRIKFKLVQQKQS